MLPVELPTDLKNIYEKTCLTIEDCETIMRYGRGDLYIPSWSHVKTLPNNLVVRRNLEMYGSAICTLPDDISVGQSIMASSSKLRELNITHVHGNLLLSDTNELKRLPDGLTVDGDLVLDNSGIECLPSGLHCKRLIIRNTKINIIPEDLVVVKDIWANNSEVSDFRLRHVPGFLNLDGCQQLKTLPDGLTVDSYLDISHSGVCELSTNMVVGGINISHTDISKIPSDIIVSGGFNASYTPIQHFPLNKIKCALNLSYCTKLETLPDKLYVGASLNIRYTSIKKLPEGLRVGGSLDIRHSQVTHISDNMIAGSTVHIDSGTTIGHNVIIVGPLYVFTPNPCPSFDVSIVDSDITIPYDERSLNIYDDNVIDCVRVGTGVGKYNTHFTQPVAKYVDGRYIIVDGFITPIASTHHIGKYTIYKGIFKGKNVVYDGKYYAHCDKIRDGVKDIEFKHAKDRALDEYKELTLDSVLAKDYAVTMYRNITGACQQGTQMFIDGLGDNIKDAYTIAEIIELTDGRYGSDEFKEFFNKED